jgi:hypothetical protein
MLVPQALEQVAHRGFIRCPPASGRQVHARVVHELGGVLPVAGQGQRGPEEPIEMMEREAGVATRADAMRASHGKRYQMAANVPGRPTGGSSRTTGTTKACWGDGRWWVMEGRMMGT